MKLNSLVEIIALLFVILFLYTGLSKLLDYSIFKEQIGATPLLESVAPYLAWSLPLAELVVAVLLFWPPWRTAGLFAALGLMILFTGYIIYIMSEPGTLPCSCGGIIEVLSWKGHIVFNCLSILLVMAAILMSRQRNLKNYSISKL